MITTFDKTEEHVRPGMSYRHSQNLEICKCACLYLYLLASCGSGGKTPTFHCEDPGSISGPRTVEFLEDKVELKRGFLLSL
jgi:hypothetical protein